MFSKSRINEPGPKAEAEKPKAPESPMTKPSHGFHPFRPEGQGRGVGPVVGPDRGRQPAHHGRHPGRGHRRRRHPRASADRRRKRHHPRRDRRRRHRRQWPGDRPRPWPEGPPDLDRAGRRRHHPQDHRHRIRRAFRRLGAASGRPAGHRSPGPRRDAAGNPGTPAETGRKSPDHRKSGQRKRASGPTRCPFCILAGPMVR
jgi:hypothetical protein